jgi:hypothetical protein
MRIHSCIAKSIIFALCIVVAILQTLFIYYYLIFYLIVIDVEDATGEEVDGRCGG